MKINRSVREILRTSSGGKCKNARLLYVVSDCPGAAEAIAEAAKTAPEKIDSAVRQGAEITASPGGGIYEVAFSYALSETTGQENRHDGDRVWKFAVNGTYAELATALETVRSIPAALSPADNPGALINWNGKFGQESGSGSVRVLKPVFTEICRATFALSRLDSAYKRRAAAFVGKVNSETFHHWTPGEVMLESIVQSDPFVNSDGDKLCDVIFTFAIRPNGTRNCAGYLAENVDGWDHLWAVTDTLPGAGSPRVRSLHISRIYERVSFAGLEL